MYKIDGGMRACAGSGGVFFAIKKQHHQWLAVLHEELFIFSFFLFAVFLGFVILRFNVGTDIF